MIAIGYDFDNGQVVHLPIPGEGGAMWAIGGSTGSGKSRLINAVLAQLAEDPCNALVISDIGYCDYSPFWGDRASCIAVGPEGAGWLLEQVEEEIKRRLKAARRLGVSLLPITPEHPRIVVVFDELAVVTQGNVKNAVPRLTRLATIGRKVRVSMIACTQSPKATVLPMIVREMCSVRIALRCEEPEQADCILGTSRIPAHKIPFGQPGRAWVKLPTGAYAQVRAPFVSDEEAKEIARRTAHLTPELGHGWRRLYDPDEDES